MTRGLTLNQLRPPRVFGIKTSGERKSDERLKKSKSNENDCSIGRKRDSLRRCLTAPMACATQPQLQGCGVSGNNPHWQQKLLLKRSATRDCCALMPNPEREKEREREREREKEREREIVLLREKWRERGRREMEKKREIERAHVKKEREEEIENEIEVEKESYLRMLVGEMGLNYKQRQQLKQLFLLLFFLISVLIFIMTN
mmetsp:Transcript_36087/g.56481  ORF Transcript_36087/g.56481 Transcript_36087/m.56481 type:complete len:202 (-) Transcript_36087:36-641(-)